MPAAPRVKVAITACPACGPSKSEVTDSRGRSGAIHRRRRCLSCAASWSTVEIPAEHFKVLTRALRQALFARNAASEVAAMLASLMPPSELSETPKGTNHG